jgi:hypothetical protein
VIAALTTTTKQAIVMAGAGVGLVLCAIFLARRQLITVRYALGWIAIGALVIVGSLFTGFVPSVGRVAGMTPTAVLLAGAVVVLVAIAIQLSISVSGLQRQLRDVIQRDALNHAEENERGNSNA